MRTLSRGSVTAALYRLPTAAFTAAFPALLADGALTEAEVEELELFASMVQDINRGLDNAARAADRCDTAALEVEWNRNMAKCFSVYWTSRRP
jgi:hypothetical protein